MDSETWLEKAERLRSCLARGASARIEDDDVAIARDRMKIALWLRTEFGEEDGRAENVLPFAE